MEYKIIVEDAGDVMGDSGMEASAANLSVKVNEAINEGGGPLGGVTHSENRQENPFLLQTMIRSSNNPSAELSQDEAEGAS